jgi:A/G-specific adenine glycosylase
MPVVLRTKMQKSALPSTSNDSIYPEVIGAGRQLREMQEIYRLPAEIPWRRLRTPYRVFLAEFLLVRTRADVVIDLFEDIVARYPDVRSLATADELELAVVLAPLGLRKRVPLLMKGARYLAEHHNGDIPAHFEELLKVPGLGLYTAAAIAAFAYNSEDVPADVNILRFVARFTGLPMKHVTKGSEELRALLPLLSQSRGGPGIEILLDFSRLICRSRLPQCNDCPLREQCTYFRVTAPESAP